jgi:SLT domain-containing protein
LQRNIQKAFADNERAIQATAEQENRDIQKAFKDEQRALDLANAEAINKILASAKSPSPQARRSGGGVEAGQPYLVGEEGPELIYPNRAGYVVTARETAAMMNVPSVGISAQPSLKISTDTKTLETKMSELVSINRDLAQRLLQQERNTFTQTNYYGQKSSVLRGSGI